MKLVCSDGNEILFDTGMTPDVFSKTRFVERIREKGYVASREKDAWMYEDWSFSEAVSRETSGNVFLKGSAFKGCTLGQILESSDDERIFKAICAVCESMKNPIGAEGIYISENMDKILYLPEKFYEASSHALGEKDFANVYGYYVNDNLHSKKSCNFTKAVLAYLLFSKHFPFEAESTKNRNEDVRDGNFMPVEYMANGICKKLSDFIDCALSGKDADFDFSNLADMYGKFCEKKFSELEMQEFDRKREKFLSCKEKKTAARRWIRKRQTFIAASLISLLVVGFIAAVLHSESLNKPTTKSLTSLETVEMFYSAVNTLNIDAAHISSTKELDGYVEVLSNMFISAKGRAMYDINAETESPASWFEKRNPVRNIYGITQFFVDGRNEEIYFEGPRRNTNPKIIHEENGKIVEDNLKKKYAVVYYILDSSGDDLLTVIKQSDSVELTFCKDKWKISSLEPSQEIRTMKYSEFQDDFVKALEETSKDGFKSLEIMRKKYDFLPTEKEFAEAKSYNDKRRITSF